MKQFLTCYDMYYNVITLTNINRYWNLLRELHYYCICKPLKTRYSGIVYSWAVLLFVLHSSLDGLMCCSAASSFSLSPLSHFVPGCKCWNCPHIGMVRVNVVPHLEWPEQVSPPVRGPHAILTIFSGKPPPLQIEPSALRLATFSLEMDNQLDLKPKFHQLDARTLVLLYTSQTTVSTDNTC